MPLEVRGVIPKIVFLIGFVGVLYLSTIRTGEAWDDDFAMYVHEAKNIAVGIDYRNTGYIYEREYAELGPKTYPPVFPLLLAGVYKGFGLNLTAMKVEVILLFLAALFVVGLTFRDLLSPKQLLALIALVGLSPYFWNYKENISPDLPFLLLAYLSMFLIHRNYEQGASPTYWSAALVGVVSWSAYGTRSVGICIIGALWLRDAIRLRKLSRFSIVATVMFVLGAAVEMRFVQPEASYMDQFRGAPALFSHAIDYVKSLSVLWDNGYSLTARVAVLALFSLLAAVGFAARVRRKVEIFETFSVAYLGVILLWPAPQDRLLIPLVPLYFFYVLIGLDAATRWATTSQRKLVTALIAMMVLMSYAGKYSKLDYGSLAGIESAEARDLFNFVRTETGPQDVFIFRRPRALALFTERSSAAYYWTPADDDLWKKFCEVHATHIITGALDDNSPPLGAPSGFFKIFAKKYSADLQKVYWNRKFEVYRIARTCDEARNTMPDKPQSSSRTFRAKAQVSGAPEETRTPNP